MKVVVIGGTGLIGSKLTHVLRERGCSVIAAAPSTGVNVLTGEGLAEALAGAHVVVDVANSPSFEDLAAMKFFLTAGTRLLAAEEAAGVEHHVVLSVVGTDRLQASGYFCAKSIQEDLVRAASIPYTIVHATQFFEFTGNIAQSADMDGAIHLPPALMQPIAADDVAAALADIALSAPHGGVVEIAGPDRLPMTTLVQRYLQHASDPRSVVTDPKALYFGLDVDDRSLVPDEDARIGATRFESWLAQQPRVS